MPCLFNVGESNGMRWLNYVLTTSLLAGSVHMAVAGVIVGGTRVVYDGSRKEAAISVKNSEKTRPYLIQSWVEDAAQPLAGKAPFIMTPPLFRLDAEQENVLRIIRTGGEFAQDRESVFWVNIKSIPASEQTEDNQLLISVKSRIKLFYRPTGISGDVADAYRALVFKRQGNQLHVNNPTAYHISFFRVSVGNKDIDDAGMVAPKSNLAWALPEGANGPVSWQAINDYGGITAAAHADL